MRADQIGYGWIEIGYNLVLLLRKEKRRSATAYYGSSPSPGFGIGDDN